MTTANQQRGAVSYHAGLAAERQVRERYIRQGLRPVSQRWRGTAGEIDLIFDDRETLTFVEVKKSSTFEAALQRLRPRQIKRLYQTAEEFSGQFPEPRELRFDLAVVDRQGRIETLENVFAL